MAAEAVVGPGALLTVGRANVIAGGLGRKHARAVIAASRW